MNTKQQEELQEKGNMDNLARPSSNGGGVQDPTNFQHIPSVVLNPALHSAAANLGHKQVQLVEGGTFNARGHNDYQQGYPATSGLSDSERTYSQKRIVVASQKQRESRTRIVLKAQVQLFS